MDVELQGILSRAGELCNDLGQEYTASLDRADVSERAKNLFHEVLIKLRSALDITMMRVWQRHLPQSCSIKDRKTFSKKTYFPICDDLPSFDKSLANMGLSSLRSVAPEIYAVLLKAQPFSSKQPHLRQLRELANLGKHVKLAPQTRISQPAKRLVCPNGSIMIYTNGGTFSGTSVGGVPIDSATQQPVGAEDINYVHFSIDGGGMSEPHLFCLAIQTSLPGYIDSILTLL